ncbi:MAG TPA: HWE histidine kinase domain-containing protein [Sphingomonas sp.]|uniref:sensor histidine kinase n=1 Tax=Sphingomonas sp. TaxID=28214 RepID=UPI002C20533F|nr:HWE histidine kinase domain-containing protein [Sphingomonas sp.]HMI19661.1 HWE histidine kinase domain-containing protein [Sphingomonas sp.]
MTAHGSYAFTLSQLSALARAQNDLLTSDSALAASREATAFLESILNATKDCVIVLALDGTLAFMNSGGQAIMEIDDFAMVEGSPWPALWEEEYEASSLAAMTAARAGQIGHFTGRAQTTKNVPRWWDVTVSPIFDEDGEPAMLLSISRDITIAKSLELQQELLAGELSHRVKNILTVVQAIAMQSFRGVDPHQLNAYAARIAALASAQALLIQTAWQSAPIHDVIVKALAPHCSAERCVISGPALELNGQRALALALAVHELATNAVKYGALSNATGRIHVQWEIAGGELRLSWRESGGPVVGTPGPPGFGTRIVSRNLAAEFKGAVDLQLWPSGLVVTLTAPL